MIIYLIRHGEYRQKEGSSHEEEMASGLTPFGQAQSRAVARFLKKRGIAAAYSSSLARARETAEIISSLCIVSMHVDERLNEFIATLCSKDRAAIKEAKRRARADHDFSAPDGESINRAVARFCSALDEIAASGQESVAVVSHEMITQFTLTKLFSLPEVPSLRTASVTVVAYKNGAPRLIEINRTIWSTGVFFERIKRKLFR